MDNEEREKRQRDVGAWLEKKYIFWMQDNGRKTLIELAEFLDVSHSLLSRWMNGIVLPGGENVVKIANHFGVEFYDLVGWVRPICYESKEKAEETQSTSSSEGGEG